MRTVAAPTKLATLGAIPRRSSVPRYSPSVVQVIGYLMSPSRSRASRFISGVSGPIDQPSPITSSVTPCRMSLWPRGSSSSDSLAQLSMLMKPGATAKPLASIRRVAAAVVDGPT